MSGMTHSTLPKSLADLHVMIDDGAVPTSSPASILAFLALLRDVSKDLYLDRAALVSEETFCGRFPVEPQPELAIAFGDVAIYRRCRSSIHRHCKLAGLWHPRRASWDMIHVPRGGVAGGMRGTDEATGSLFSDVDLEERVPAGQPLRKIRRVVSDALASLDGEIDALCASHGCPSIPPERLIRTSLLQIFYSVRSEQQLMEQMGLTRLSTATLDTSDFRSSNLSHSR